MDSSKKEKLLQTLVREYAVLTESYEKELRRLRLANLKLKLHMEVLVSNPKSKTAEEIKQRNQGKGMFAESILHYN
jgi:hypothetical protein